MSEIQSELNDAQKEFLLQAEARGVNSKLFGEYIPEIQFQEENPDSSKPTIAYIHTGGTLAMVPSTSESGAISFEGAIHLEKIILEKQE